MASKLQVTGNHRYIISGHSKQGEMKRNKRVGGRAMIGADGCRCDLAHLPLFSPGAATFHIILLSKQGES